MKTTFLNDNTEGNLESVGREALQSTLDDLEQYKNNAYCGVEDDFCKYGLSFDLVAESTDYNECYYRYQLSWGGPSDEIRLYPHGRIEYVYMDWFCGVGFDVSNNKACQWLYSWFDDLGMLDIDRLMDESTEYAIVSGF